MRAAALVHAGAVVSQSSMSNVNNGPYIHVWYDPLNAPTSLHSSVCMCESM